MLNPFAPLPQKLHRLPAVNIHSVPKAYVCCINDSQISPGRCNVLRLLKDPVLIQHASLVLELARLFRSLSDQPCLSRRLVMNGVINDVLCRVGNFGPSYLKGPWQLKEAEGVAKNQANKAKRSVPER